MTLDLISIAQGILLLVTAPFITGLLNAWVARFQGRRFRPRILQPYADLWKLLRQPPIYAYTTTLVFSLTPLLLVLGYGLIAFSLPVISSKTLLPSSFILLIFVLALLQFVLSLSGLDTATGFGWIGSSRLMFLHVLAEISLVLVAAALVVMWKTSDLNEIMASHWDLRFQEFLGSPEMIFLAMALFLIILFECELVPIGSQHSHLELTFISKAPQVEYAGSDLGLIMWAKMLKLSLMFILWGNLFFPAHVWLARITSPHLKNPLLLLVWFFLIAGLGYWVVSRPRIRLRKIVEPALFSIALSLIALTYALLNK